MSVGYGEKKRDPVRVFNENMRWIYHNRKISEKIEEFPDYNMRIDKSPPYDPKESFHNFVCDSHRINGEEGICGINFGKNSRGLAQHVCIVHDPLR